MNNNKKGIVAVVITVAVLFISVFSFLSLNQKNSDGLLDKQVELQGSRPEILSESSKPQENSSSPENQISEAVEKSHRVIMGTLIDKSIDELMEESGLILSGTLGNKSEAFTVLSADGGTRVYTDYYIKPIKIYRESSDYNLEKGDLVTIRIEGGETATEIVEVEGSPEIDSGKEYLFFLYQPQMGGSFNTQGDYYYILGAQQGIFVKPENIKLAETKANETNNEVFLNIAIADEEPTPKRLKEAENQAVSSDFIIEKVFEEQISAINDDTPVNVYQFKEEVERNLKTNLDNGFISQQEYDDAINGMKEYAVIVEE